MTSPASPAEFQLVPFWEDPSAQFLWRGLILTAIIGCFIVGALYLAGLVTRNLLLFALAFAPGAVLFYTWRIWHWYSGDVQLDDQGLVLETGFGKQVYAWSAVQEMGLAKPSDFGTLNKLAAQFAGVDENRLFVAIALTRRPRVSLVGNRIGTDVSLGVPRLSKRIALYLVQPNEFMREAARHRPTSPI